MRTISLRQIVPSFGISGSGRPNCCAENLSLFDKKKNTSRFTRTIIKEDAF